MRVRARSILSAISIVLAFLAFAISPAFAAEKVFVDRVTNLTLPVGDVFAVIPSSICGVAGPFTGDIHFNVLQFVFWDNGHHVITSSNSVTLFDPAGNLVLRDRFSIHDVGGPNTLPSIFGISLVSHCTPNSATPGRLYETHLTVTVGEDGILKQIHGELCDPAAYPFC